MRTFSSDFNAALSGAATTLAWCWHIERSDGVVIRATDHDRDLIVDGSLYAAATGRLSGAVEAQSGFSPDTAGFAGILDTDGLTEADIAVGLWDGARVTLMRVNWRSPDQYAVLWRGRVDAISHGAAGFEAELVGEADQLSTTLGRVVARRCDAALGDARCGVDLSAPGRQATGSVLEVLAPHRLKVSAMNLPAGHMAHGRVIGPSGRASWIDTYVSDASGDVVTLREPPASDVVVGAAITVEVGCDKALATCRARFANAANFRGFPFVPGNDWLASHQPMREAGQSGSLFDGPD